MIPDERSKRKNNIFYLRFLNKLSLNIFHIQMKLSNYRLNTNKIIGR